MVSLLWGHILIFSKSNIRAPELCEGGFPASARRKCVANRRCIWLRQAAYATRRARIEDEDAAAPSRVSGECGGISVPSAVI